MNLRPSSQAGKHLRWHSPWPKPSLRNRSKPGVSICVDINPLLESSEQTIFYYFGAAITESQYLVNLLLLQSLIMHHLTTGLSFTLLILFKSFCLFSHLFFSPILCVLLITLLHCHRLFQHRHVEPEVVWSLAVLYAQWIVCYCDI